MMMVRRIAAIEPATHEDEAGLVRIYLDDRSLGKYALLYPDAAAAIQFQMRFLGEELMDFPDTAPVYVDNGGVVTQVEGPENDDDLPFTRRA